MKALVCHEFGPPDTLRVDDIEPPAASPGHVVIDVRSAALNFPDTLLVAGKYQVRPERPFVPGGEAAGTVAAVGDGVEGFEVGQAVIGLPLLGAFAERVSVPAQAVVPMPEAMDFDTAAGFVMAYATSYHALKQRAALAKGETLLVLGAAGGVGLAAVELGRAMGARVIAAASTDNKLAVARDAGAHELINYEQADLKAELKTLTDGRGVDVVYDPVGGDYTEAALRATAWDGRYLVIGFASGRIPSIPLNLPLLKGLHIVGVFWGTWVGEFPAEARQNLMELFELYTQGRLAPRVTQTFDLNDYAQAFATLTERRAIGKVILRIGG